jgi:hypothetical protein
MSYGLADPFGRSAICGFCPLMLQAVPRLFEWQQQSRQAPPLFLEATHPAHEWRRLLFPLASIGHSASSLPLAASVKGGSPLRFPTVVVCLGSLEIRLAKDFDPKTCPEARPRHLQVVGRGGDRAGHCIGGNHDPLSNVGSRNAFLKRIRRRSHQLLL